MNAIAAWFVYGVVVSALLGLAALAAESGARAMGRPARWVWFGAMVLAILAPVVAYLVPSDIGVGGVAPVAGVPVLSLPAMAVPEEAAGGGASVGTALLAAWALASTLLAGVLVRSASRAGYGRDARRAGDAVHARVQQRGAGAGLDLAPDRVRKPVNIRF